MVSSRPDDPRADRGGAEASKRVEAAYATSIASMPSARRFPPPWTIEENNDACFIVKDASR